MMLSGVLPCVSVVIISSPVGLIAWAFQVLPIAEHIGFELLIFSISGLSWFSLWHDDSYFWAFLGGGDNMDLFSRENCIRGEMQPERGNPYVADDIRRVCIGKRGSMRSLRENRERPFLGEALAFSIEKVR